MEITFGCFLLLSLLTDIADGYIARKERNVTKLGSMLDSVGDAMTFVLGLLGAWEFHKEYILMHLVMIAIVFGSYLLQIIVAIIKYGRPSSFHTYMAKLAAIVQGIFLLIMFFYEPVNWIFYIALIITAIEIIEEIALVFIIDQWKTDVKGLFWVLRHKNQ